MVFHAYKKLEETDFVNEEFLCKKITAKAFICGLCCAKGDIPEDACSYEGSQAFWRFDSHGNAVGDKVL